LKQPAAMSTQSSDFPPVPLGISQPFQNIRLLEVPDEVLDIITNSDEGLYLKSSPSTDYGATAREGDLHLCSDNKAWLVKQVSTSNSVYVTRASNLQQHETEYEGNGDHTTSNGQGHEVFTPDLGLTAIAKPTNILELYHVPAANHETTVTEHLNRLVPTISRAADQTIISQYSLQDLYNHIPAPTSLIKQVLARRCVFELPWSFSQFSPSDPFGMKSGPIISGPGARAYIPAADLLLETWHKINEAATISDTNITGDLEPDMLLDAFPDIDDPSDRGDVVHKAIARRMFEKDGYFVSLGLIMKATDIQAKDELDGMEMTRWVGSTILEVHTAPDGHGVLDKDVFEEQWENAVPAAWVKYCSVEVLASACNITKDEQEKELVSWRPFATEIGTGATPSAGDQESSSKPAPAPATSSKGKRKWHEKFAAQRNVRR